jgi:hypothetical protein
MADARPVTDDCVERDIISWLRVLSGAPSSRIGAIGCATWVFASSIFARRLATLLCLATDRERGLGALTGIRVRRVTWEVWGKRAGIVKRLRSLHRSLVESSENSGQTPPRSVGPTVGYLH